MRSDAREAAYKIVFSELFSGPSEERFRFSLYRQAKLTDEETRFAEQLVFTVAAHREEFSEMLSERANRFAGYRIYAADRAAMLIALAEIKYFADIPEVVSVNEAVGLARKYSTEKSADFVNGMLAGVINT